MKAERSRPLKHLLSLRSLKASSAPPWNWGCTPSATLLLPHPRPCSRTGGLSLLCQAHKARGDCALPWGKSKPAPESHNQRVETKQNGDLTYIPSLGAFLPEKAGTQHRGCPTDSVQSGWFSRGLDRQWSRRVNVSRSQHHVGVRPSGSPVGPPGSLEPQPEFWTSGQEMRLWAFL